MASQILRLGKSLARKIPDWYRCGHTFRKTYAFLEQSEYWNSDRIRIYQDQQIRELLQHAYLTVPYYKKLFDIHQIDPLKSQVSEIPVLTKEIIRKQRENMHSVIYKKRHIEFVTTSGSTGEPMGFYEHKRNKDIEWAFMTHQWKRVGYDVKKRQKSVVLRGTPFPGETFVRRYGNELFLSSFHISESTLDEYVRLIEDFDPDYIKAYPSAISLLSDLMRKKNHRYNGTRLKAILCGSEKLLSFQRDKIIDFFGVRVFSWYGHSEKCCLAGECEVSKKYHINPFYGYTEIIPDDSGIIGELVVTGFLNHVFPLIRYRTGDRVALNRDKCPCGRSYEIVDEVLGREQEYIQTSSGGQIPLHILMLGLHGKHMELIKRFQFVQYEGGRLCLDLVLYENAFAEQLIPWFDSYFNGIVDVEIRLVEKIELGKNGKYKFIDNRMDNQNG